MPINLHFFRDNSLDKLDFARVFDFFDQLGFFEIYYTEEDVQIIAKDEDFRFSYRYLITKKSLVKNIYKLEPKYSNVNFMLELPIMIPSYLAKEIFAIVAKLCRSFDLAIYHDSFKDVQEFNIVDLDNLFNTMRQKYIEDYGLGNVERLRAAYESAAEGLTDIYNLKRDRKNARADLGSPEDTSSKTKNYFY